MSFYRHYENSINFLLEKGNTTVRYRTLSELCDTHDKLELEPIRREIAESERANQVIDYLKNTKSFHGGPITSAENSLNILVDMGIQYGCGFDKFNKVIEQIANEVQNNHYFEDDHVFRIFFKINMVPFLYRAGFKSSWVKDFILSRINLIHSFVLQRNYDIYDDIKKYKSIPSAFKGRPIIKPELYANGDIQFPLEYDFHGFAAIWPDLDNEYKQKVNEIVEYILDDKFQSVVNGYGILLNKNHSYLAMGWDPKPTNLSEEITYNPLLLKLCQLAHFPSAVNSTWFKKAIEKINQYADQDNIYKFPKEYLTEKDSIWILGNHMGLGENRQQKHALLVEGTFRALKIHKLIDDSNMGR